VRPALAACLLAIGLLVAPHAVQGNMAQTAFEGDRSSILVPGGATTVRVDHEELSFVLRTLAVAEVTASYQVTNAGAAAESDDVAFALVRPGGGSGDDETTEAPTSVEVDGARVRFRAVIEPDVDGRWSSLPVRSAAGVGLLLFHLDFEPGQTRSVTVRYEHHADVDRRASVHGTLGFDYLLSPARHWAGFGPLDISVRLPAHVAFSSRLPFERDGDGYRAHFAGLPEGELRFEVTSLDGVWLGMTAPGDYWVILLVVLLAATIAVGARLGRRWAGSTGWKRVLLPLLVAGPLAAMASVAVELLLGVVFPDGALGVGYGPFLGSAFLVLLAMPIGAVVSAVAARRARQLSAAHPPD
jgi:hypothetical protein